jgi:uncharacterized protein (TIGR00645 family)
MRAIALTRYLALIGVVFGWIASLAAFAWGAVKTIKVVGALLHGELDGMAVALVSIIDAFLIAAGLLIFALGLYELFVGQIVETNRPAWLEIHDLDALKSKLAGIIVMVLAVAFLERLESATDARAVFYAGVGVAAVSATMIALTYKHKG